jgi:hypothetical protein
MCRAGRRYVSSRFRDCRAEARTHQRERLRESRVRQSASRASKLENSIPPMRGLTGAPPVAPPSFYRASLTRRGSEDKHHRDDGGQDALGRLRRPGR